MVGHPRNIVAVHAIGKCRLVLKLTLVGIEFLGAFGNETLMFGITAKYHAGIAGNIATIAIFLALAYGMVREIIRGNTI